MYDSFICASSPLFTTAFFFWVFLFSRSLTPFSKPNKQTPACASPPFFLPLTNQPTNPTNRPPRCAIIAKETGKQAGRLLPSPFETAK
jgi:hypothetical protein